VRASSSSSVPGVSDVAPRGTTTTVVASPARRSFSATERTSPYTDHEIGRVIQAVEDLGELDNTLIIYISGDNGSSAEGMVNGTPNEFTTFNGVAVPVKDQFRWYEFWGSERTYPHVAAGSEWTMATPFKWVQQVASHFGGWGRACACPGPATSRMSPASAISSKGGSVPLIWGMSV
jgi:Sulfatase